MDTWRERAKRRMTDKGITQDELILILGVTTRGAVGHYLSGRREPSVDQLIALATFLKFQSLDEFLTGKVAGPGDQESVAAPPPPQTRSPEELAALVADLPADHPAVKMLDAVLPTMATAGDTVTPYERARAALRKAVAKKLGTDEPKQADSDPL